jgi:hypothetical protein
VLLTLFVIAVTAPVVPYPNIALSLPYPAAARKFLAVPTPVVSVATTPVLFTRLVTAVTVPVLPVSYTHLTLPTKLL